MGSADFAFAESDLIMLGRESAGVPEPVHAADARLLIPLGLRSLNVATAAAMVLGEALRQTGRFPSALRMACSAQPRSKLINNLIYLDTSY